MKCVFLSSFKKDIQKIRDRNVYAQIHEIIRVIEAADSIQNIPNLKKMHGRTSHYRVRASDYRIGVVIDSNTVTFMRCLNRADIYKHFP